MAHASPPCVIRLPSAFRRGVVAGSLSLHLFCLACFSLPPLVLRPRFSSVCCHCGHCSAVGCDLVWACSEGSIPSQVSCVVHKRQSRTTSRSCWVCVYPLRVGAPGSAGERVLLCPKPVVPQPKGAHQFTRAETAARAAFSVRWCPKKVESPIDHLYNVY